MLAISQAGLERRARLNAHGADERTYLAPLAETLALERTPAELLLDKLNGPWRGSIDPIFDEYAY
jgi:glutamate--cysteine ligase